MKTLMTFCAFFIATIFISCSDESQQNVNETDEFVAIDKLADDPIFVNYIKNEIRRDFDILDILKAIELNENFENLSNNEKDEFAVAIGYEDFENYEADIDQIVLVLKQLEKTYNISGQDREIIDEAIAKNLEEIEISNFIFNQDAKVNSSDPTDCMNYPFLTNIGEVTERCFTCRTPFSTCFLDQMTEKHADLLFCTINQPDDPDCLRNARLKGDRIISGCAAGLACCVLERCELDCSLERARELCSEVLMF